MKTCNLSVKGEQYFNFALGQILVFFVIDVRGMYSSYDAFYQVLGGQPV